MDCEDALRQLPGYVDQALAPPEMEGVRQHLGVCPACRHEEALYLEVEEALLAEPVRPVPAGFVERVMRRVGMDATAARVPQAELRYAGVAALLALCALGAFLSLAGADPTGADVTAAASTWFADAWGLLADALVGMRGILEDTAWLTRPPLLALGAGLILTLVLAMLRLKVEPYLKAATPSDRDADRFKRGV